MKSVLLKIWNFYYEGFTTMSRTSRTLWIIVLVKLFIMFAILKVFFFRSELSIYDTPQEKAGAVIEQLTERATEGSTVPVYPLETTETN